MNNGDIMILETIAQANRERYAEIEKKIPLGTIHWVSARHGVKSEVRLYENIVDEEKGKLNEDGTLNLNPNSLTVLKDCYVEPNIADVKPEDKFQFVRQGYFCADLKDYTKEKPVFNRIVSLKSSFKLPK